MDKVDVTSRVLNLVKKMPNVEQAMVRYGLPFSQLYLFHFAMALAFLLDCFEISLQILLNFGDTEMNSYLPCRFEDCQVGILE